MRDCFVTAILNPIAGLNSKSAGWRKQFHPVVEPADDVAGGRVALGVGGDGAIPRREDTQHHHNRRLAPRSSTILDASPDTLSTRAHQSSERTQLTHSDPEDFGGFFHIPGLNPQDGAEASLAGREAGHRGHVDLG